MKRYYWSIGLLSAAVLASEIALTRIFAYLIWYHGVFMIISMALLGFAASGSVLTLAENRVRRNPGKWIRTGGTLFAVFIIIGIFLPGVIPLESKGISLKHLDQLRNLAFYFIFWGAAFMMPGMSIILILQQKKEKVHRVYFSSMAGSGIGCVLAMGLLYAGPVVTLSVMALISLGSALLIPAGKNSRVFQVFTVALLIIIAVVATGLIRPDWKVATSKVEFHDLAQGRVRETHWSPISVVQIFNRKPGWNYVDPGLAIHLRRPMPEQKGIIIDAFAQTVFTQWDGSNLGIFDFFPDCSTSAAYLLRPHPRSLVIGVGGGIDILRALYFGARSVVGVELNGILVDLLRSSYCDFTGKIALNPRVKLVKDEGRSFVMHVADKFDIIQIDYTDTWSAAASGGLALAENFLYTAEAVQDYYRHLTADGILSITRTLSYPYPGETLRVTLTAIKALQELGIARPLQHMMAVTSPMEVRKNPHMSATLLICKRPFTEKEIEEITAKGRGKWLVLFRPDDKPLPPVSQADAPLNKQYYQWVKEKMEGTRKIFASFLEGFPDDTSALENYAFDVSPLTDNRPFYYFFARWRNIWNSFKQGKLAGNAGGVILLLTLSLALTGSLFGIFVPLVIWQMSHRKDKVTGHGNMGWYALYFAGLGFGYIAVELNLIQQYSLFLGHPVYALGVMLGGLLIFSGVGSYLSGRVNWRPVAVLLIFLSLFMAGGLVMLLPGPLFKFFAGSPVWLRALVVLIVISPLGVLMGMPFPLGLRLTGRERPLIIPWLWGINGFASVIGSILATIAAIMFGYNSVTLLALIVYALALLAGLFLSRGFSGNGENRS